MHSVLLCVVVACLVVLSGAVSSKTDLTSGSPFFNNDNLTATATAGSSITATPTSTTSTSTSTSTPTSTSTSTTTSTTTSTSTSTTTTTTSTTATSLDPTTTTLPSTTTLSSTISTSTSTTGGKQQHENATEYLIISCISGVVLACIVGFLLIRYEIKRRNGGFDYDLLSL